MKKTNPWIEAIRLRTLPVSAAGVVMAAAYGVIFGCAKPLPIILCLLFALLAQTASNFANEYYDFRDNLDKPGRVGPRRGVTEGDITPGAMKRAIVVTLTLAAGVGLSLIYWGGWWLIGAGILIGMGVLAYSAGPYPLSRHALGEVAVIIFFGIIPVNLTFYVLSGNFDITVFCGSTAIGLMGADILLVNNYRDTDDDRSVGKITLSVKFGKQTASTLYLFFGYIAIALLVPLYLELAWYCAIAPTIFLTAHTLLWIALLKRQGAALNPLLGMTAMNMFIFTLLFLISVVI